MSSFHAQLGRSAAFSDSTFPLTFTDPSNPRCWSDFVLHPSLPEISASPKLLNKAEMAGGDWKFNPTKGFFWGV